MTQGTAPRSPFGPKTAAAALTAAALLTSCLFNTELAGTSSGVDNPGLVLGFRDGSGAPLRVTGTLSLFAANQNPALDPNPAATLKVDNADSIVLLGSDLSRFQGAVITAARASAQVDPAGDTAIAFSAILKSDSGTGFSIAGLVYRPDAKTFSLRGGASLRTLRAEPKPLQRYQASLRRGAGLDSGRFGRVYIPGSPYSAVVVDSVFAFDGLPQGVYPLRVLAEDGRVFAVQESLDTKTAAAFTPSVNPVEKLDPAHNPVPDFSVDAGPDREAFLGSPLLLMAKISGVAADDARLSILWRQLRERGDTAAAADLSAPTAPQTEARFPAEGVYRFVVAATMGLRTLRDTVTISAHKPPPPTPRVVKPKPGEILHVMLPYSISWEMPGDAVTVKFSPDAGATWTVLAENYHGPEGLPFLQWTPPRDLAPSDSCLIRVISAVDSNVAAQSEGFFLIKP